MAIPGLPGGLIIYQGHLFSLNRARKHGKASPFSPSLLSLASLLPATIALPTGLCLSSTSPTSAGPAALL